MTDESRLDWSAVNRGVAETVALGEAELVPAPAPAPMTADEARFEAELHAEAAALERKMQADMERILRTDCALLYDWLKAGIFDADASRGRILTFVCLRRGVEQPAWGASWVAGKSDA